MTLGGLHQIFKQNTAIGIDIEFYSSGVSICMCVLKRKKRSIHKEKILYFKTTKSLLLSLKNYKSIPLYLNLRGLPVVQYYTDQALINSNSNTHLSSKGELFNFKYQAIAQRSFVDQTIDQFSSEGICVLGVHLGMNFSLLQSAIQRAKIPLKGDKILMVKEGMAKVLADVDSSAKTKAQIVMNDKPESIASAFAFAAGLSFFSPSAAVGVQLKELDKNKLDKSYEYKTKVWIRVSLTVLLLILLLNFFLFDFYYRENNHLSSKLAASTKLTEQLHQTKEILKNKKSFVHLNALNKPSLMAYRADQLALLLPVSTYFTSLELLPAKNGDKKDVDFISDEIRIEARTEKAAHIELYIKQIQKLYWVNKVTLQKIETLDKTHELLFHIVIKVNQN